MVLIVGLWAMFASLWALLCFAISSDWKNALADGRIFQSWLHSLCVIINLFLLHSLCDLLIVLWFKLGWLFMITLPRLLLIMGSILFLVPSRSTEGGRILNDRYPWLMDLECQPHLFLIYSMGIRELSSFTTFWYNWNCLILFRARKANDRVISLC